jgi:serine phosphatase RsbU (regulator of sigma subunit)
MLLQLEVQIAVAKVNKYAVSESGDTVEVIERPHGGLSVIVADGQRSGHSAKAISNIVVRKALSLLAEGVRDGAVARATHDYLRTERGGKVSAELVIASVDLTTQTVVISRNARCPVLLCTAHEQVWLDEAAEAVGIHRFTKPSITEVKLAAPMTAVIFTDGVWHAGSRTGTIIDLPALLAQVDPFGANSADVIADAILAEALRLDGQRPHDDATVSVIKVLSLAQPDATRRLFMRFPI